MNDDHWVCQTNHVVTYFRCGKQSAGGCVGVFANVESTEGIKLVIGQQHDEAWTPAPQPAGVSVEDLA